MSVTVGDKSTIERNINDAIAQFEHNVQVNKENLKKINCPGVIAHIEHENVIYAKSIDRLKTRLKNLLA